MGDVFTRMKDLATKTPEEYLTTEDIHAELRKLPNITDHHRKLFFHAMKKIEVEWVGFRENCRVVIYLPESQTISIGKAGAVNVLLVHADENGKVSSTWESAEGLLTTKQCIVEGYEKIEDILKWIATSIITSAFTAVGIALQKKITG